jgi:hypothetical protein
VLHAITVGGTIFWKSSVCSTQAYTRHAKAIGTALSDFDK